MLLGDFGLSQSLWDVSETLPKERLGTHLLSWDKEDALFLSRNFSFSLMVNNPLAMQETQVRHLGQEDPLGKGESHGYRTLVGYSPRSCKESDTTERLSMNACLYIKPSFKLEGSRCHQNALPILECPGGTIIPGGHPHPQISSM